MEERSDGGATDPFRGRRSCAGMPADVLQHEVTRLILAAGEQDREAADRLLALVYDQLRMIAQRRMNEERAGHTLQATALVHEAYLRLFGDAEIEWQGRGHFFAVAAEAMRRILIDRARQKRRERHGGGHQRIPLERIDLVALEEEDRVLALDEALTRLAQLHPSKAELIKLCHFCGLSIEEAADVLGVSRATAYRQWEYARVWLLREMGGSGPAGP